MARFVVMEPADGDPAKIRFVRDGFSLLAFIVPPVWLLWHRLFAEAAIVVALMLAIGAGAEAAGLGFAGSLLSLLVSIHVGLEAASMHIAGLARRGWRQVTAIDAECVDDADIRFAAATLDCNPGDVPVPQAQAAIRRPHGTVPQGGPVLGLLSYPG
jgi:hypothetical protein